MEPKVVFNASKQASMTHRIVIHQSTNLMRDAKHTHKQNARLGEKQTM